MYLFCKIPPCPSGALSRWTGARDSFSKSNPQSICSQTGLLPWMSTKSSRQNGPCSRIKAPLSQLINNNTYLADERWGQLQGKQCEEANVQSYQWSVLNNPINKHHHSQAKMATALQTDKPCRFPVSHAMWITALFLIIFFQCVTRITDE